MDRNLDIDNFERLLKERTDEFKMYPTKRVWHSIYNNIHPGRKWPSIAMSITLISILLLIGFLNTENTTSKAVIARSVWPTDWFSENIAYQNPFSTDFTTQAKTYNLSANNFTLTNSGNNPSLKADKAVIDLASSATVAASTTSSVAYLNTQNTVSSPSVHTNTNHLGLFTNLTGSKNKAAITNKGAGQLSAVTSITYGENELKALPKISGQPIASTENTTAVLNDAIEQKHKIINGETEQNLAIENGNFLALTDNLSSVAQSGIIVDEENTTPSLHKKEATNKKDKDAKIKSAEKNRGTAVLILTEEDKAWIENYALYNKPIPKKWAGKLAYQLYVTPSVVYRALKDVKSSDPDVNNLITQHPSIGLELGAGISYPLVKGIRVKTGLQLNFTRYNAEAFENSHPVATSISLNDGNGQYYQSLRNTPYTNSGGITPVKLHNETYQISIPIGLDFKIAGNDILQWNVGTTIQPSFVFGGKSYILSTDKRNYIKETSLLNRFNLNAGFETFLSYKTNGFTLQLGPQFRQQLFTTNKKQYIIQEKLVNYGFKFGITKLIK